MSTLYNCWTIYLVKRGRCGAGPSPSCCGIRWRCHPQGGTAPSRCCHSNCGAERQMNKVAWFVCAHMNIYIYIYSNIQTTDCSSCLRTIICHVSCTGYVFICWHKEADNQLARLKFNFYILFCFFILLQTIIMCLAYSQAIFQAFSLF